MKPPLLSILTPACWNRVVQGSHLHGKIISQRGSQHIEHLVLYDNRARSIGMKRQALLNSARGDFIAFVDDDDDVSEDYVTRLIEAIIEHPEADVITFDQAAIYNGKPFTVHFQLGAKDDKLILDGPDDQRITRGPWHVCAWRRTKIRHCQFLDTNYGEDAAWVAQARQHVTRAHHIDGILHTYRHDARTTLAPEV
jgi:glycosyltransferase involved in cell wall biosynthesis